MEGGAIGCERIVKSEADLEWTGIGSKLGYGLTDIKGQDLKLLSDHSSYYNRIFFKSLQNTRKGNGSE